MNLSKILTLKFKKRRYKSDKIEILNQLLLTLNGAATIEYVLRSSTRISINVFKYQKLLKEICLNNIKMKWEPIKSDSAKMFC